ncbi:uncharacterized protein BDV14DRAFT_200987 [Aspergillus stella-maris]|uniref:uncharacterized protein n=1 Tax=Aspergillus stella-maris TaxID=1810926 RepID=UPI003CCCDE7F
MFIPLHPRVDEAQQLECGGGETRDTNEPYVTVSDKTVIKVGVGISFAIIFLCLVIAVLWFQPWRKWKRRTSTREEQSPFMGGQPEAREIHEPKQSAHTDRPGILHQRQHQIQRKPVPLQRRLTIKLPRHVSGARRSRTPEDQLTSLGPDPLDDPLNDSNKMSTPDEALLRK